MLDKWIGKNVKIYEKVYGGVSTAVPLKQNVIKGKLTSTTTVGDTIWLLLDDTVYINLNLAYAIELDD